MNYKWFSFKSMVLTIILLGILISPPLVPTGASEKSANAESKIRHPAVAGSFYPGSRNQLRKAISSLLNKAPLIKPEGEIIAAMAPHAGYVYSGSVAAYTFKQLSRVQFDTIVIIGHDSYQDAVAYTCPVDYFETPLGKMALDREMIKGMQRFNAGIKDNLLIHSRDHTIEVQLPFLQVLGKGCKIVPIMFGKPTVANCRTLAKAIAIAGKGKKVLILASTDMSHYPPYDYANRIDKMTLEKLKTMDLSILFTHLQEMGGNRAVPNLKTAMCAKGGVGAAIDFSGAFGANHVQILHYANSGDAPIGDKQGVVGYSSALFIKK